MTFNIMTLSAKGLHVTLSITNHVLPLCLVSRFIYYYYAECRGALIPRISRLDQVQHFSLSRDDEMEGKDSDKYLLPCRINYGPS
jgi:hypothetical protein